MKNIFVAMAGMKKGDTDNLLHPFLEGMEEAGGKVDLCYIKQVQIKPCIGDFRCWYKTPGKCFIKDGMQELYSRIADAEILVFATPIYTPIPGEMQHFINRLVPLMDPVVQSYKGRMWAKAREGVRWKRISLVSTSGWWGVENFASSVKITRDLAFKIGVKFGGSVLRPHAFALNMIEQKKNEVYEATRKAGGELVKRGNIPRELQDLIAQPLISEEKLRSIYDDMREKAIGRM